MVTSFTVSCASFFALFVCGSYLNCPSLVEVVLGCLSAVPPLPYVSSYHSGNCDFKKASTTAPNPTKPASIAPLCTAADNAVVAAVVIPEPNASPATVASARTFFLINPIGNNLLTNIATAAVLNIGNSAKAASALSFNNVIIASFIAVLFSSLPISSTNASTIWPTPSITFGIARTITGTILSANVLRLFTNVSTYLSISASGLANDDNKFSHEALTIFNEPDIVFSASSAVVPLTFCATYIVCIASTISA